MQWEIIPPLIFLGLGALSDFGPMLAKPGLSPVRAVIAASAFLRAVKCL
ncbi:hypothetical protein [Desulfococcus sp.]